MTATSGQGSWNGAFVEPYPNRFCSYENSSKISYDQRTFECDGAADRNPPWVSQGDSFVVKCYVGFDNRFYDKNGNVVNSGYNNWYRMETGRNAGRYIITGRTSLGEPETNGIPRC